MSGKQKPRKTPKSGPVELVESRLDHVKGGTRVVSWEKVQELRSGK